MQNGYKIKRSGKIYREHNNLWIKILLGVVACALLFVVGWGLYRPVLDFLTELEMRQSSSAPPSESSAPPPQESSQPDGEGDQGAAPVPAFWEEGVHAVWIPTELLRDTGRLSAFLLEARAAGCNAVLIDCKDQTGYVVYTSFLSTVADYNAMAEDPIDLRAALELLHGQGFAVLARVYAFEDHVASRVIQAGPVLYMQENDVLWLDDSFERGGRPWLNPYSTQAQEYVRGIVQEVLEAGCDGVLLDGVRFPPDYGIDFANFGPRTENMTRGEVLAEFTQSMRAMVEQHGGKFLLAYSAAAVAAEETGIYGGSPAAFPADAHVPVISPTELSEQETLPATLLMLVERFLEETGIPQAQSSSSQAWQSSSWENSSAESSSAESPSGESSSESASQSAEAPDENVPPESSSSEAPPASSTEEAAPAESGAQESAAVQQMSLFLSPPGEPLAPSGLFFQGGLPEILPLTATTPSPVTTGLWRQFLTTVLASLKLATTEDTIPMVDVTGLAAEQMREQAAALDEAQVRGYILYEPEGKYLF